ncbi:MAG: iron-containing alcohol dehydrogenase family protein [Promethearchaeota archaeon]
MDGTKAENIVKNWKLTDITFGLDTVVKVGEIAEEIGLKKALIVIGGGSVEKNGYLTKVIDALDDVGIEHVIFRGVEPNPSIETTYSVALKYLYTKSNGFIGLGGGSVLDIVKAANVLVSLESEDITRFFGVNKIESAFKGKLAQYIEIPTTSGTSAEVTKYSNITDHRRGVKKLISDPTIIPPKAIVDPKLTVSCPAKLTRVTGLDTLTHLMEGYVNNIHDNVDPKANERAIEGMKLLFKYLPVAIRDGSNIEARRMMSLACVLGGTVIVYKSTGGPHMNSFSWFNVLDHGESTAVMLPYYIAYYGPNIEEKLEKIAEIMGLKEKGDIAKTVVEGLLSFYKKIGQNTKLSEYENFSKDLLDKAIKDAKQNQMKLDNMPRPIPVEKVNHVLKTILQGAWTGNIENILNL